LLGGVRLGIRSERRLCDEVRLNLAYRWFCRLGLDGDVPDHSKFSKNRHCRFRESDLFSYNRRNRSYFDEGNVESCMITFLRRLAVCVGLLIVAAPLAAEDLTKGAPPPSAPHGSTKSADAEPSTAPVRPLPAEATTTQVLNFASRKLDFKATTGSIRLSDDKGAPED
jgi:hypothetical protein